MNKNEKKNSAKRSQRTWSFMGLFIMALVISMPFYSAQSLAAAITITTNTGQAGIPNYIDAQSDIWKVEATITDQVGETVDPANVRIASGGHETKFTSCSTGGMGTVCQYLSPLPEGVNEQMFRFNVKYYYVDGLGINDTTEDGGFVYADRSAPKITMGSVEQNSEGVRLQFQVEDQPAATAVGLKSVTVKDANTGEVLKVIDTFDDPYQKTYDFSESLTLSGEGNKHLRISAEDLLGHKSRDVLKDVEVDFVKPSIQMQTLNFTKMGDFIGQYAITTNLEVDVIETNMDSLTVTASSEQATFSNPVAACENTDPDNKLWHCTWENVDLIPVTSITVRINATDASGNSEVQERTKTFFKDETAPTLEFFGTEHIFEGRNYISPDVDNRIILKVSDQPGVGMASTGVTANLGAFGKSSAQSPTQCEDTEGQFTCYWDAGKPTAKSGTIRFGLSKFEDKVENKGTASDVEAVVDNSGPNIEEMTITAVSEDGREKDFYQSNDKIKIHFITTENSGLVILVDENELVNDAETLLPENTLTRGLGAGWEIFTEQNCLRNESKWDCTIETLPIKSGLSSNVKWTLKVRDTAGNEAAVWPEKEDVNTVKSYNKEITGSNAGAHFTIDILGLSTEESPDYWEAKPAAALGFVDMDITSLIATRQIFNVNLNSDNNQVFLRSVELNGGCELNNTDIPVGRIVTWSNNYIDGKKNKATFVLMMEFQPFDSRQAFASMLGAGTFDKATVTGTCQFLLYSQVGEEALRYPEIQEVPISVDFAFTELGGKDENLAQMIKDATEAVNSGWWGALAMVNKGLKIITYLAKAAQIFVDIVLAFQLGKVAFAGASLAPIESELPAIADAGVLGAITFCIGSDLGAAGVSTGLDVLQVPLQILTCKKISYTGDEKPGSVAGWYNSVVYFFINYYNQFATFYETKAMNLGLEDKDKIKAIPPAVSVYDNIYLSIISLCIPGMIHNLEKARQIECRRIYCLKSDVPQGLATVEACSKLKSVMTCKYFWGPLLQLIPFVAMLDGLMRGFSSLLTDPIAIVSTSIIVGCSADCLHTNRVEGPAGLIISSACVKMYFLLKVVGIVESVWSGIQDVKAGITSGGGSNYCDQIDDDEEEDEEEEAPAAAATEGTAAPAAGAAEVSAST